MSWQSFFQPSKSSATQDCVSACRSERQAADQMAVTCEKRIQFLLSQNNPNLALCRKQAEQTKPALDRFNRYRTAMPYAKIAEDMDKVSDYQRPKSSYQDRHEPKDGLPPPPPCVTRLPQDAEALNKTLCLPTGTITPADLKKDSIGHHAALYRDETTGKIVLVNRSTQNGSLQDWQNNILNAAGEETPQYQAASKLSKKLVENGVKFDITGYSKGGGQALEAALVSPSSQVVVFNSASLHPNSLSRKGHKDFANLAARTQAYSSEDDFLTYMNETTSPAQQLANIRYLRQELDGTGIISPISIDHRGMASPQKATVGDKVFPAEKQAFLAELDQKIAQMATDPNKYRFHPVQAAHKEVVANSGAGFLSKKAVGTTSGSGLSDAKFKQHLLSNVTKGLHTTIQQDQRQLEKFITECG